MHYLSLWVGMCLGDGDQDSQSRESGFMSPNVTSLSWLLVPAALMPLGPLGLS